MGKNTSGSHPFGLENHKEVYIDILEEGIVPEVRDLCRNSSWTFVHDGAPAHRAKMTKKWLEEQKVRSLGWPANSPDLNIIETIWNMVKQEIKRREPKSADEIWQAAKETWDNVSLEEVRRQFSGWGRRLSAVVKNQGGHTKY